MTHLLSNFYTEQATTYTPGATAFSSTIRLNPDHEVYKGHFPQVPVAPGVVLIQTIKEILMEKLGKKLRLTEGDNVKFLALINPQENADFQVDFTLKSVDNVLEVNASYVSNSKAFTKFKGKFLIVD